jgi:hypothetical protein
MEDNWISVFSTDKPWQAEIAKQVLLENRIDSVIINKKDSSYLAFGDLEVYVSQENEIISTELLKTLKIE